MSSSIDAFSGSGNHPNKCVSNHILDLSVFVDVDSAVCPKFDASNILQKEESHTATSEEPRVIFQKNLIDHFFAIFQQFWKQFLFFKLEYLGQICTQNFK